MLTLLDPARESLPASTETPRYAGRGPETRSVGDVLRGCAQPPSFHSKIAAVAKIGNPFSLPFRYKLL
jgi:hypothetical protein